MTTTITTSQASTTATAAGTESRKVNVTLWVLQALAAAMFVIASLPKLAADPQAVSGFADIGFGTTGMYIIGALELLGAVALLIPRLCGLAGLAFIGLMTGAVIVTVSTLGVAMAVMPAVVLVVVAVIAWGRRHRTAALVDLVRQR